MLHLFNILNQLIIKILMVVNRMANLMDNNSHIVSLIVTHKDRIMQAGKTMVLNILNLNIHKIIIANLLHIQVLYLIKATLPILHTRQLIKPIKPKGHSIRMIDLKLINHIQIVLMLKDRFSQIIDQTIKHKLLKD